MVCRTSLRTSAKYFEKLDGSCLNIIRTKHDNIDLKEGIGICGDEK